MDKATIAGFGAVLSWVGQLLQEVAVDGAMADAERIAPPSNPETVQAQVTDIMSKLEGVGLAKRADNANAG